MSSLQGEAQNWMLTWTVHHSNAVLDLRINVLRHAPLAEAVAASVNRAAPGQASATSRDAYSFRHGSWTISSGLKYS
jgi:hypothetical protein